ncbi:hypothetical protein H6768_06315 [Candidatus Peribacteria bacterium]|nr:hypothetical protein [Candidatus Peribacteria bacterium]
MSQSVSAYFTQTNDTTTTALLDDISTYADVIGNASSGDTALGFSTSSPSTAYDRLNGTNGLSYVSGNGSGMLQISLNPDAMKFRDFGRVLDINLKSIKGFPNFIMDWYQRQMDEIMSSLTHLPDLKIYLPDLSSLADK